jgi:hypothetical protein
MGKRLRTVSTEDGIEVPQARLSHDQATALYITPWRPSQMKTGLRNRLIGKKVSVRIRKRNTKAALEF